MDTLSYFSRFETFNIINICINGLSNIHLTGGELSSQLGKWLSKVDASFAPARAIIAP